MIVLPEWVIFNLRKYHNSLIDTKLVKKESKESIIEELKKRGFEGVTIHIVNNNYIVEVKRIDRDCQLSIFY